jgi:CPA1 family monovalent cation:H+ antiporter
MTAATGIEAELLDVLAVFVIAASVGVFVAKVGRFPYTIALLLAGLAVSILGVSIDIELSRGLILLVLLPPLLFEGAATTDLERFRRNFLPIVALAVPGLVVSILLLGWLGTYAFGFPLLIALLFAAMILPTDPVSVLALFEELGVPDRLAVLVEGESLINDGVGVVIFTALFGLVVQSEGGATELAQLASLETLGEVAVDITVASLGGLVVGAAAGYLVYRVMATLDEHMTEIVLTLILAYGSFLLAEHYLHVSGVIATVAAGLLIGNRGAEYAMSPRTKVSVFDTWDTAAFIVNTFIFLLIGAKTPVDQLLAHLPLIGAAAVLVLVVRAAIVYPIVAVVNRWLDRPISLSYRHVMVWGGLHASIPIALVLGLPAGFPFREELRAMVFGVAAASLLVQGLSMARLVSALDVVTRTEAEELYELLTGRLRAVDAALAAVEEFDRQGNLSPSVAAEFRTEYERERADLEEAIAQLLSENPSIRHEEALMGERRVLTREKSTIMDAVRSGMLGDDVGQRLLDEVDLKIDQVEAGESTVRGDWTGEEAYREFWRTRAAEYGLESGVEERQPSDEPTS